MYIPSIGLFIILAWGAADLVRALRWRPAVVRLAALVCLAGCCAITWRQVSFWHDSLTLFERALAVTCGNDIAQMNLSGAYNQRGDALARQNQWGAAEIQYREALRVLPYWAEAMNNLASALTAQGKCDEADAMYAKILHRFPDFSQAHYKWGLLLARQGRYAEAADHFKQALHLASTNGSTNGPAQPPVRSE
jgi:tetratricopeptide (TPR) repeat protein